MASSNGKLKGKPWSVWAEEMHQGSPSSDSEPGSSALPPTEDVMKLPREDMATYGQCPIWDRFILVTCHRCSRKVKVEALEAHVTLRHGSKSERNAYHKIKAAQAETALRACQISSTPMNRMLSFDEKKTYNPPDILVSGSSSSTSPLPVSYPSTPPNLTFRVSSPSPVPTPTPPLSATPSIQPADSASAPETRSPTPDHGSTELSGEVVEHMDIDLSHDIDNDVEMLPALPSSSSLPEKSVSNLSSSMAPSTIINYVGEEADSTTHNVISIPDSDDIPNIEIGIISEGQVLDSINTKYNVAILKTETSMDSTTSIPKIGLRPGPSLQSGAQPKPVSHLGVVRSEPRSPTVLTTPSVSTPPRTSSHPARQFQFQHQDPMDIDNSPTQYITVSPLSKGSPKKPIIIKTGVEKKLTGREREYDPNKHCGVWDADAKRNCTRSLTCKSHSVYLKRKVTNRSAPFDELLAAHKAEKEAAAKLNESSSESEPTSILARRLQLAPGTPQKPWELSEPLKQSSLLKCSVAKRNYFPQTQQFKDNYCDENLHYTTGKNTSNLIKSKQYLIHKF